MPCCASAANGAGARLFGSAGLRLPEATRPLLSSCPGTVEAQPSPQQGSQAGLPCNSAGGWRVPRCVGAQSWHLSGHGGMPAPTALCMLTRDVNGPTACRNSSSLRAQHRRSLGSLGNQGWLISAVKWGMLLRWGFPWVVVSLFGSDTASWAGRTGLGWVVGDERHLPWSSFFQRRRGLLSMQAPPATWLTPGSACQGSSLYGTELGCLPNSKARG